MANMEQRIMMNGTYGASSAARELNIPSRLPEQKKEKLPATKVKAKVRIQPFTIVGVLFAVTLMLAVVMGNVRLYEAKSANGRLTDSIQNATAENSRLRSQYESLVDFDQIDLYAISHGMKKSTSAQTVYVSVPSADNAQIRIAEESSMFEKAWTAVVEGFHELVSYRK